MQSPHNFSHIPYLVASETVRNKEREGIHPSRMFYVRVAVMAPELVWAMTESDCGAVS